MDAVSREITDVHIGRSVAIDVVSAVGEQRAQPGRTAGRVERMHERAAGAVETVNISASAMVETRVGCPNDELATSIAIEVSGGAGPAAELVAGGLPIDGA